MAVTALAGWFGGNRLLAHHVGEALRGCSWVGIPFAGGMSEVPHITARTIVVNDIHRLIINLARVTKDDDLRPALIRQARRKQFHPDELLASQTICKANMEEAPRPPAPPDLSLAVEYFVCCWMGRGGKAGVVDEFNGRTAVRWKSDGGDSMVRYQSAIRMLAEFSRHLRRCTFDTKDAIEEFLPRCEDIKGHGIYADPPFVGVGRRYKYNAGETDAAERAWHTRLRDALARFKNTRVVCRFYDHPLVRELYPSPQWTWLKLEGGKTQANASDQDTPEVLVTNGVGVAQAKLFA